MADSGEFIEGLSKDALKNLQTYNAELMKTVSGIDTIANKLKNVKSSPSQSDEAQKQLIRQYDLTQKAILKYQLELLKLAEVRKKVSQQTVEESVNQGILNQRAREAATINSTLAGAYKRLSAEQNKSARAVQDLIARGKLATQTQKQYDNELANAQKQFEKLNTRVLAADRAVGRFNRNVGNYPKIASGFKDLLGAFGIIGGVTAIAAVSVSIFNTTRELQSLDLALRQVLGSSEETAKAQAFLRDIADKYGVGINELTKSYTQFYVSAKDKLSGVEIQGIFDSISKAAGAMGLSVEQQDGAFLALTQMLSKGTIQAEELRGQLSERLPGAFGILAKSMGVTEQELNKLLKDGKVIASEVLPAFAKELERAYGIENLNRVESLNASTTRLSNTWKEFVRTLNDGDGVFSKFLSGAIEGLSNILKGFDYLITSSESQRAKDLKRIRTEAYNEYLAYYQADKDITDQYIQDQNAYLQTKAQQAQKEVDILKSKNSQLEKNRRNTPFGSIMSKADENELNANNKRIKELNNILSRYYGEIEAGKEVLKKENVVKKESNELSKEELENLKRLREERLKNKYSRELSDLERRKKLLTDQFEDENKYAAEKIKLSQEIADIDNAINSRKFIENLRLHQNSLDLQAIDANEFRTQQENNERESQERILKVKEENFKAFQEYRQKYGRPTGDEEKFGQDVNFLPTDQLDALIDGYKEFNDQKKKSKDLTEEEKKAMLDYFHSIEEGFFADAGLSSIYDILSGQIVAFGEDAATTFIALGEVAKEAYAYIEGLQQASFDRQLERLQQERDVALLFAGESASGREEIERQYAEREKQLKRQKAESDKRNAIFKAVINTAQAVTAYLAETDYSGAIIAGIVGAAQIALISSQPIPQYYVGTQNAKEGLAWTNERGAEIVTDKYGNIKDFGDNKGKRLQYLSAGDKVYTAEQTKAMMFNNELNGLMQSNGISSPVYNAAGLTKSDMKDVMSDAMRQIPKGEGLSMSFDERGVSIYKSEGNNKQQLMNAKLMLKSR